MHQLDHIGIAVKDFAQAIPLYQTLLQTLCYKQETVADQAVDTAFFAVGNTKIELLQSTTPDGVIAKYISSKGEGIHHIAFAVHDIAAEIIRLQAQGYTVLNPIPKLGADNKLVTFLHPKSTHGVLIELCQDAPL